MQTCKQLRPSAAYALQTCIHMLRNMYGCMSLWVLATARHAVHVTCTVVHSWRELLGFFFWRNKVAVVPVNLCDASLSRRGTPSPQRGGSRMQFRISHSCIGSLGPSGPVGTGHLLRQKKTSCLSSCWSTEIVLRKGLPVCCCQQALLKLCSLASPWAGSS